MSRAPTPGDAHSRPPPRTCLASFVTYCGSDWCKQRGSNRAAGVAHVLDRPWLDVVAVAGLVTGLLGLGYAFAAQARVRGMRRTVSALERSPAIDDARRALQRVAVVRYDAFGDTGGRLSWSAAVLDGSGDGLVITTITGRSVTRSYAKAVTAGHGTGQGTDTLSPEEHDAVSKAVSTPMA